MCGFGLLMVWVVMGDVDGCCFNAVGSVWLFSLLLVCLGVLLFICCLVCDWLGFAWLG